MVKLKRRGLGKAGDEGKDHPRPRCRVLRPTVKTLPGARWEEMVVANLSIGGARPVIAIEELADDLALPSLDNGHPRSVDDVDTDEHLQSGDLPLRIRIDLQFYLASGGVLRDHERLEKLGDELAAEFAQVRAGRGRVGIRLSGAVTRHGHLDRFR